MALVYKGPAQIEFGGVKFQTQGDATLSMMPETFDVMTDAHGTIDTRMKARTQVLSFTPSGTAAEALSFIISAAGRKPGTSIMGGALTINPFIASQSIITLDRAGITGLPGLKLGASKTLFGNITFTALETVGANTGVIAAPSTYASPTSDFAPNLILTEPWKGTYSPATVGGSEDLTALFTNLETEDGWEITTDLVTDASRTDAEGIVDYTQTDFKVTVSCKPVGLTDTQMLALVQRSAATRQIVPGQSMGGSLSGAAQANVLTLTSRSGYVLTLVNAGMKGGNMAWGSKSNRTPMLSFTAHRSFSAGALQPLLTWTPPGAP